MTNGLDRTVAAERTGRMPKGYGASGRVPTCFVVDADGSIRHFLSLILHGAGVDTVELADGKSFAQAIAKGDPDLVFLNVGVESSEAIDAVLMLAQGGYTGFVQLMSSRGSAFSATSRAWAISKS
jgi:DNA-binding response OmpR family regulator